MLKLWGGPSSRVSQNTRAGSACSSMKDFMAERNCALKKSDVFERCSALGMVNLRGRRLSDGLSALKLAAAA